VKITGWVLKSCEFLEAVEILLVSFREGVVLLDVNTRTREVPSQKADWDESAVAFVGLGHWGTFGLFLCFLSSFSRRKEILYPSLRVPLLMTEN